MSVPLLRDYSLQIWKDGNNDLWHFRETTFEREEICLFKALRWLGNSQAFSKYFKNTKGLVFDRHELMKNGLSPITCAYYGCHVDFITIRGSAVSNKTLTNIEAHDEEHEIQICDDFDERNTYKLVVLPKFPSAMRPRYVHCYEFLPKVTQVGSLLVFLDTITNKDDENEKRWKQNRKNWLKENNFILRFHGSSNGIVPSTISGAMPDQGSPLVAQSSNPVPSTSPGTSHSTSSGFRSDQRSPKTAPKSDTYSTSGTYPSTTDSYPSTSDTFASISTDPYPSTSTDINPSTSSVLRSDQRPLVLPIKSDIDPSTTIGTTPSTSSAPRSDNRPLAMPLKSDINPRSSTGTTPSTSSGARPDNPLLASLLKSTHHNTSTGLRSDQRPLVLFKGYDKALNFHVYAYEQVGQYNAKVRESDSSIEVRDLDLDLQN